MFKGSYYFLFALIAVLLLGLVFGGSSERGEREQQSVLPEPYLAKLQDVSKVTIAGVGNRVEIERRSDGWVVANRYNYVANEAKLIAMLRDLKEASLLEEKTKKPENHDRLGVGPEAISVSLDDEVVLLFGQRSTGRAGRYMRYADSDQVWLQSAVLSELDANPGRWLQDEILAVPNSEIASISIQHPDETLTLKQLDSGKVEVEGVSQKELRYEGIADPVFNMLSNLRLQDIAPLDTVDISGGVMLSVTIKEAGLLEMQLVRRDGMQWLKVNEAPEGVLKARPGFAFAISPLNYDNMTKRKAALVSDP